MPTDPADRDPAAEFFEGRRAKLLSGLDVRTSVGLEIGPLASPMVRKQDGEIIYVDHADTASLRENYAHRANVDAASIVEVDAVWGVQTLQEAIGSERKADYVVASHVIEHVPDLITWMSELRSVLKPGGEVRLVVPDRRFTFDYLRRQTSLADIFNAYLVRARRPLPISILDFTLNARTVSNIQAWEGKLDSHELVPKFSPDVAMNRAREALVGEQYDDVHCWVFTPRSFAELFAEAGELGLVPFACSGFHDTARYHIEFFVALRPCDDRGEIVASWRKMAHEAADLPPPPPPPSPDREEMLNIPEALTNVRGKFEELISHDSEFRGALANISLQLDRLAGRGAELLAVVQGVAAREAQLTAEVDRLRQSLAAVHASTSWQLTAPLRAAVAALRRR